MKKEEEIKKIVAVKIQDWIDSNDLNEIELATLLRRDKGEASPGDRMKVSRWLRGESLPTVPDLIDLADTMNCDITAFFQQQPKKVARKKKPAATVTEEG